MDSAERRSGLLPTLSRLLFRRHRALLSNLNDKYKTFVGPGHWFEMERRYLRIGYGWPKTEELKAGLAAISLAAAEARS